LFVRSGELLAIESLAVLKSKKLCLSPNGRKLVDCMQSNQPNGDMHQPNGDMHQPNGDMHCLRDQADCMQSSKTGNHIPYCAQQGAKLRWFA
ncbi:MAG: hypothetical protein AAGG48_31120, partial [Planctomycetota bacterium]